MHLCRDACGAWQVWAVDAFVDRMHRTRFFALCDRAHYGFGQAKSSWVIWARLPERISTDGFAGLL